MNKTLLLFNLLAAFITSLCQGGYTGSGYVTQGRASTTITNLFVGCTGSRVSGVGSIASAQGTNWIVPAQTQFSSGVYLPDLYNQCNGVIPANLSQVNLATLPVHVINVDGEVITAFIFGDNYYELYVNGMLVGVDRVPYTPFNSSVVKFKVKRPYTIALMLVDWEENLGLGTENNNGNPFYAGDGGVIVKLSDGTVTDTSWRVQTFYIAPIEDLSSVSELPDGTRATAGASTAPGCSTNCYAVHYTVPTDWASSSFNDAGWPKARLYTAAAVAGNNAAYWNLAAAWEGASFIWSSNLFLDNLVLARKTVYPATGTGEAKSSLREPLSETRLAQNSPNPFTTETTLRFSVPAASRVIITLYDITGSEILRLVDAEYAQGSYMLSLSPVSLALTGGIYFCTLTSGDKTECIKMLYIK